MVTRDRASAAELAAWLAPTGRPVVPLPVTRVEPATPAERAALAALVAGRAWPVAVVASRHAADALADALADVGRTPTRVLAVGEATRRALDARGLRADTPARADAVGLAAHLLAGDPPAAVLWPRAAGGRTEGVERLRRAGVEVVDPVAYRTVARAADDPALAPGRAAWAGAAAVCVYAPSQVEALDGLGLLAGLAAPVVAVGATTAAALAARGRPAAAVATSPDAAAMARAVAAVLPNAP